MITIALSKGRIFEETLPLLQAAGITLGTDYPLPVVDHTAARARTLLRYGALK